MTTPATAQIPDVSYQLASMVVQVKVHSCEEVAAVEAFAHQGGFACPAPSAARPVYHCTAKTHPNGEVLWG